MRHVIVLAVFAAIVTSAFTTVLVNGLIFGADAARSASESELVGAAHPVIDIEDMVQGDVDCDGDVDAVDGLKDLQHVAALDFTQTEPCPDIGTVLPAGEGIPGPQGEQGPQGAQVPPGISGHELVSVDVQSAELAMALCPAGKLATGGGVSTDLAPAFVWVAQSQPVKNAQTDEAVGWAGRTESDSGAEWTTSVFAICVNVAE